MDITKEEFQTLISISEGMDDAIEGAVFFNCPLCFSFKLIYSKQVIMKTLLLIKGYGVKCLV